MTSSASILRSASRAIVFHTAGHTHGPITRLASPGDLGELIKPFVFLDLFHLKHGNQFNGFGFHPHSGIATVTYMIKGNARYEDSTGKSGVLPEGGVEWMQAGGGVWHTAGPADGSENLGFQLWVALPEALENGVAESLYISPGDLLGDDKVKVLIGEYQGIKSALKPVASMNYFYVSLRDGEQWVYEPPANHDVAFLALHAGKLVISGQLLERELAIFEPGNQPLTMEARGDVGFVLGTAQKHAYPLVLGSYSVHTSEAALQIGESGIKTVAKRMRAEGKL